MIDKKKFKNAINKSQKAMQNAPTDQSMTVDVKNEELEAQIKVYTKEKTRENLNRLIEIARKCRLLVPANLNEQNQPVPCLLNSQENGLFSRHILQRNRFRRNQRVRQLSICRIWQSMKLPAVRRNISEEL